MNTTKEQQGAFNAGLKVISRASKSSGKTVYCQLTSSTESTTKPKDDNKKPTEESDSPSAGNILADNKRKTTSKYRAFRVMKHLQHTQFT